MYKTFSLFLLVLFFNSVKGQTDNYIITTEQNDLWIDKVENSPLDIQVKMVKARLKNDTAVYYMGILVPKGILRDKMIYIPQNYVAGLNYQDLAKDSFQINGFKGQGRLIYGIRLTKGRKGIEYLKRDSTTLVSSIVKISDLIKVENITSIEILKPTEENSSIYGNHGFGGVIINTNDKKIFKEVVKLNN